MKPKIITLIFFAITATSFGQQNKLPLRVKTDNVSDSLFTLPFQLPTGYEFFDSTFAVPPEDWARWTDTLLGLSFLCPVPYDSTRDARWFWLWRPAGDTVLTLYFGAGVTLQVYKSTRSFAEIAFAEGFKQFQKDTSDLYPISNFDTLPNNIVDTNWVLGGVSGMASEAYVLQGTRWKGLSCVTDTRAQLPEQQTTYIAEVFVALFVCRGPSSDNIAFLFRVDPDDSDSLPGHNQPRLLSEAGFYLLIASVRWANDH